MTRRNKLRRQRAYRRGVWAEYRAALYLMLKGYRVVARRFRTKSGEVDLIARRNNLVVFVEVKARAEEQSALDAISKSAQTRIANAGEHWIASQSDYAELSWRIDVIVIRPWRWPVHFEDVW